MFSMFFNNNPKKIASQVQLAISRNDNSLVIWARAPRRTVGYAFGGILRDRIQLDDLKVYDDGQVTYPFANRIFGLLLGSRPPLSFRSFGIGSRLLCAFIDEARKLGVREIWGSVQGGDVQQTPHLFDFYRKHGFIITEPDNECMDIKKWRITMRLV